MSELARLEAILFVASQPLGFKKLSTALGLKEARLLEVIQELKRTYNKVDSGIHLAVSGTDIQMVTNPNLADAVGAFKKVEYAGELTPAQLETLTIIAYQQPVTRPEIENIRGVNCAVILRNLLQRGLTEERERKDELLPFYYVSVDAIRTLGIASVEELPDYETLHDHEYVLRVSTQNE